MLHVITKFERPDKDLIAQFAEIAPATAHEVMHKTGSMAYDIKPIYSGIKVCGPALTVHCHPGDNIMIHKAVAIAQEGDVLVVNVGSMMGGNWGEILTVAAQARGIAGLVIDGGVRDGLAIKKRQFPVFCRGLCVNGTVKETLGLVNHPVSCGGVMVRPADIVLGDDDGVVVVPKEKAQDTLAKSKERQQKEDELMQELMAGKLTLELLGFHKVLESKGLREE